MPRPSTVVPAGAPAVAVAVTLAVALLSTGYVVGVRRSTPPAPDETSVEVGFARDMSIHHSQAVNLAMLAYGRASSPAVRDLADDIVLAQQREVGVMHGWLQQWGRPQSNTSPPMAWMAHAGATTPANAAAPTADTAMPGMIPDRAAAQLAVSRGHATDVLFCQLMLRHHLGGLHMISEVLKRSHRPEVVAMAIRMRSDQQREVDLLQRLLSHLQTTP